MSSRARLTGAGRPHTLLPDAEPSRRERGPGIARPAALKPRRSFGSDAAESIPSDSGPRLPIPGPSGAQRAEERAHTLETFGQPLARGRVREPQVALPRRPERRPAQQRDARLVEQSLRE